MQPLPDEASPTMSAPASADFTPHAMWIAFVARHFELDLDRLNRRVYQRRHKRSEVEYGQARVEFGPDPETRHVRRTEHLTVMQVSPDGVMLRGYEDVPSGTAVTLFVRIEEDCVNLRGVIRHTTMTLGGYKIGIELQF